ncbi:NAD(P)H-dependent oxidoreductase [Tenacibaculum finnmarkense]|uniref:NAD(P)H-dependent oxidoreductase n=1 Tax=Tenacibaculum finnmarkense TaxID=2781243 RepID=UPI001EFAF6A8|nr:NAD(P)H-dependent oxidoreductase [Tenacibaculum finnmarkense]MCG8749170.1 NAD(P)H-dependent oxidoreductase [Tenacibaculum finnmarkense]MCG8754727.1 NAD(P)H-dependent oxidoreductase [Tenacibaculum finnmarkense]MCG8762197.1 NAD(P)H-dependent oxidoreductase [Tenacibaculum finnmarkense]MCG8782907.1 NAD(P)H-dependent oxidoreductase [Tenacibaculum finnmarkense]MCG8787573.1 NAD(P)H-dependent oxidoreductase [Tenacibaculum finnmarkense]
MKHVLIINGHPDKQSYNYVLSEAYLKGASKTTAVLSQINITDLDFNLNLAFGYRKRTELEPDLLIAIDKIKKATHIVWIFPMWWQGTPAIMKGFIDRTFLPGITYQPIEGKPFPEKLLKGKSARIIITTDTPRWYDFLVMKSPALRQFKKGTLEFCGISPVKTTYISPIKNSSISFRNKWIEKITLLGEQLK